MTIPRDIFGRTAPESILYVNNTGCDFRTFHAEIVKTLKASGELPEDLQDLFTVTRTVNNPDGTPRYVITPR